MQEQSRATAFWIEYGHCPELSEAEWRSLLLCHAPGSELTGAGAGGLLAGIELGLLHLLWARVGGSIRVAERIAEGLPEAEVAEAIVADLVGRGAAERRPVFGLGVTEARGSREGAELAGEVKERLRELGQGCRFLLPERREARLSSASVGESRMLEKGGEYLLHAGAAGLDLFRTALIQDYRGFSERDYGRPERDMRRGMLPPKLALILLNLADPEGKSSVLDPFCGVGGLLTEALAHGWSVCGSDLEAEAVEDCRKNLEWLQASQPRLKGRWKLRQRDALKLTEVYAPLSQAAIATEPYLGPPLSARFSEKRAREEVERLRPLYAAFLGQARTVLEPGRRLVLTAPTWRTERGWVELGLAREVFLSGFRFLPFMPRPLLYQRPDQRVGRRIYGLVA